MSKLSQVITDVNVDEPELVTELLKIIQREDSLSEEYIDEFIASYFELKTHYLNLKDSLIHYKQELAKTKKTNPQLIN